MLTTIKEMKLSSKKPNLKSVNYSGLMSSDRRRTDRLGAGDVEQVWRVIAGGQGLRLQSAGVLKLLDCGELSLTVAGFRNAEACGEENVFPLRKQTFIKEKEVDFV